MTMHWRQFQQLQKVVEVGDRFVSYVDVGSGPPLVLLHGLPTWGYLWHRLVPALEKSHRVLIPDLPGYGWSDRSDRFDRSMTRQVHRLIGWMQCLGLTRADFAGHDFGAAVALRLASYHPDRVERLCLLDALAYDSGPLDAVFSGSLKAVRARLREGFALADEELLDGLLAPYATQEGRLSLLRDADAVDANVSMELVPRFGALDKPTLVLWGEKDALQPADLGRRLAWDLPRARLAVLPGAGHFTPLDQPGETAAHLQNFLALA